MANINEVAAQIMEHLVTHSGHGYTQAARWGNGKTESVTIDGKVYTFAGGDRDCSSAIISAYKAAGLNVNATYTGNMRKGFLDTGMFEWKPMTFSAQRGDIYLNEGAHTAMCVSPYGSAKGDLLAEFSISENGTIYGKEGDQTGRESLVRAYYDYPWNGILHFKGGSGNKSVSKAQNEPVAVDISYRLHVKGADWLPVVKNYNNTNTNGYAGYKGKHHDGFSAQVTRGSIKYRVHGADSGWCKWVASGATASAKPYIDGIQMYYTTNPGEPYQQVWYRAHTTGAKAYLPICCDDGTTTSAFNGWAGEYGKPVDMFQAYIGSTTHF